MDDEEASSSEHQRSPSVVGVWDGSSGDVMEEHESETPYQDKVPMEGRP